MKYYLFAALALGLCSCLKTSADTCDVTLTTPIVKAIGPKTVAVNQAATYTLDYLPGNGCGKLNALSEQGQSAANTRTVSVSVSYATCNCPTPATPLQTTYNFVPTQAGTYYLKFVANNGYLTDTLVAK